MTVELLDGEEKPIPGYAAEDCVALTEDGVAIPVRWRGDGGLSALGTAGTAEFCAKQRPALSLLVSVVFGRKINLEIAREL